MNTNRVIALVLSVTWVLFAALLVGSDVGNETAVVVANIWLAAALLSGGKK